MNTHDIMTQYYLQLIRLHEDACLAHISRAVCFNGVFLGISLVRATVVLIYDALTRL